MCWLSKYTPELRIAKSPISVKKILFEEINGILSSPCFETEWVLNRIKSSGIGRVIHFTSEFEIHEGLHSCTHLRMNRHNLWESYSNPGICHVVISASLGHVLCGAIIPTGAKYYLNEFGDYVSDQLIVTHIIKTINLKGLG